jgi:hypothetical protein
LNLLVNNRLRRRFSIAELLHDPVVTVHVVRPRFTGEDDVGVLLVLETLGRFVRPLGLVVGLFVYLSFCVGERDGSDLLAHESLLDLFTDCTRTGYPTTSLGIANFPGGGSSFALFVHNTISKLFFPPLLTKTPPTTPPTTKTPTTMEITQAVKIVNECISYKREHGDFPESPYPVIDFYRKLAFQTVKEMNVTTRNVRFNNRESVQFFDKNQLEMLGFF